MSSRKIKGFTLIELLFVVAIIGLIAGNVIPKLLTNKHEAMVNACMANIQAIETAAVLYLKDSGYGEFPESISDLVPRYLAREPVCPFGQPYILNENGIVIPHEH